MAVQWHEAELIKSEVLTHNTRNFVFRLLTEEKIFYKSGQFFVFDLPLGEKRAQRWRSYTISKKYNGSNILECCISPKEGGLASQYLFNEIKIGDIVKLKGPEGTFILPENTNQHLFLMGTGTGIAPYRAMMQEIFEKQIRFKSLHWIFGTRKEEDILYAEDLQKWISEIPNMQVDICLSREAIQNANTDRWKYYNSYIHDAYIQKLDYEYLSNKGEILFYLCGWSGMIDQAVAHLVNDYNIDRAQIKFELYG